MSVSALMEIDYVFLKFLDIKDTLEILMCLYLQRLNYFTFLFENLGTERTGGIIKVVVVVDMVVNFLITDKG